MNFRGTGGERFRKGLILFMVLGLVGSLLSGLLGSGNDRLGAATHLPSVALLPVWPVDTSSDGLAGTESFDTDAWAGKGVLITFWATWCGYCREEMPMLERLHQQYNGDDFAVVGITKENSLSRVQETLHKKGVTYSVYRDLGGLHRHFGVDPIPFHVFVGPDGSVVGDVTGRLDETDAHERISAILTQVEANRDEL
jgi:thiol-disulfide isomerase/thioredoxin